MGYEIDPDRELIGLGLSNIASALSGGFPSFGSLSRTPVNYITGALPLTLTLTLTLTYPYPYPDPNCQLRSGRAASAPSLSLHPPPQP